MEGQPEQPRSSRIASFFERYGGSLGAVVGVYPQKHIPKPETVDDNYCNTTIEAEQQVTEKQSQKAQRTAQKLADKRDISFLRSHNPDIDRLIYRLITEQDQ